MSREPCDMLFRPCDPGLQDCVGFGRCLCQQEMDRQNDIKAQLTTLTKERDNLKEMVRALIRAGDASSHGVVKATHDLLKTFNATGGEGSCLPESK